MGVLAGMISPVPPSRDPRAFATPWPSRPQGLRLALCQWSPLLSAPQSKMGGWSYVLSLHLARHQMHLESDVELVDGVF